MILLVDRGNTRLKWMLVDEDGHCRSSGHALADDDPAGGMAGLPPPDSVFVCSVASDAANAGLADQLRRLFGHEPHFLQSLPACAGLTNGYREPARLGVDRWLAMLGARERVGGNLLVVDAGTALTIDAVAGNRHLGGFILPGIGMQRDALGQRTARVGRAEGEAGSAWGCSTTEAVCNGTLFSAVATVEKALVELRTRVDDTCALVMTGGDALRIAALLRGPVVLHDDLVFAGMLVQWRECRPDR